MAPRVAYGSDVPVTDGGLVAGAAADSPARRAGLDAGDRILCVNGSALRDVLDWQWHTADADAVTLSVAKAGSEAETQLVMRREAAEPWGVRFDAALFDGVKTCRNNCAFCFMTQLPKGLRRPLYVRDDDYRLSFMQGNFVTLTNLDDADVERIVEQSLSPLYVSLHAVSPEIREQLVCARVDRALERIDALLMAGIDMHVQIVLVPGINDTLELQRTLTWLAEREGVCSVGIVPLGYTSHQTRFDTSFESPRLARAVINQVVGWQEAYRAEHGATWVYLADEFYLNAGLEVPPNAEYDGYPQYENGIGIVRSFIDDAVSIAGDLVRSSKRIERPVAVVTGELAAPVLDEVVASLHDERIAVAAAKNTFFGGNVSVAGLLTADDLTRVLVTVDKDALVLLPDCIVNTDGKTLDDRTLEDLRTDTGRDLLLVSSDAAGLLEGLKAAGSTTESE